MPKSKIPSPARSQSAVLTPRRLKTKGPRSVGGSPAPNTSTRLTSIIQTFKDKNMDSFRLSMTTRRSVLNDNTDIEEPNRDSWWKKLNDTSRDIMEVLDNDKQEENYNIMDEYMDVDVASQEKKNNTVEKDIPDSSDNESVNSIVLPQRKLFTQKESNPQNKFADFIGSRETMARHDKTNIGADKSHKIDKTVVAETKKLFSSKPRSKPAFPSELLRFSPDKSVNKTAGEVKGQVRNLFGNRAVKRKNKFTDFIASESEEEPEIQPKVFGFTKKSEVHSRRVSTASQGQREPSPTSSYIDMPLDDWKLLPSSTMVQTQLEAMMTESPVKKARLEIENLDEVAEDNEVDSEGVLNDSQRNSNKNGKIVNESVERNNSETVAPEIQTEDKNDDYENQESAVDEENEIEQEMEEIDIHYPTEPEEEEQSIVDEENENQVEIDKSAEIEENEEDREDEENENQKIEDADEADNHVTVAEDEENENQEVEIDEPAEPEEEDAIEEENENQESEFEDAIAASDEEVENEDAVEQQNDSQRNSNKNGKIVNESVERNNSEEVAAEIQTEGKSDDDENQESAVDEKNEIEREMEEIDMYYPTEPEEEEQSIVDEGNENQVEKDESAEIEEAEEDGEEEEKENQEIEDADEADNDVTIAEDEENENQEVEIDEPSEPEEEDAIEEENENQESEIEDAIAASDDEVENEDAVEQENDRQKIDDSNQEIDNESDNEEHEKSEVEEENESSHAINESGEQDNNEEIDGSNEVEEEAPNVSHDTTGRNRKKNETNLKSPEAILHNNVNQMESFAVKGRNTSIRRNSMIKNLNIKPSLAPHRDSTGFSDGTKNSSVEGSGWDSHRTTRKTLRQTFGRDFTPRKSLRALVMEKSAKRQTAFNDINDVDMPRANSTELPEESRDYEEDPHEVSKRTRQTTLEMYLQKIKKQNIEKKKKLEEEVRNSLKVPSKDILNPFKVPARPFVLKRAKPGQTKAKNPIKSMIPLDDLPQEVLEDMKYKPPRRFQPGNASWITKRLYKFLESKLEPKYDYKARIRAEKLVETIYNFAKELRRHDVASSDAVDVLKHEMARLDVVTTHFEFYQFFHDYMPREIRVKVVPDVVNKIPLPRHGVFTDIMRVTNVQG